MAKRSYLDSSQNYKNAKPGMRGMSAGAPTNDDDFRKQQSRILDAIISMPSYENIHRQWALGDKLKDPITGKKYYDKAPSKPFEKFREEYDKRDHSGSGKWGDKPPALNNELLPPEFVETFSKELLDKRAEPKVYGNDAANKKKVILVKKRAERLNEARTEQQALFNKLHEQYMKEQQEKK